MPDPADALPTAPAAPPRGFRQTLATLRAAQKPAARSAPAYSRFVNRRIGRYLAAWAYSVGLGPNAVTAISALFTFAGIALLALVPPSWVLGIGVALLLVIGYAFDSADGQVARLRGIASPAGEWLDHVVDAVKVSAMPIALAVGFYRFDVVEPVWLLVPLLSAIVSAVLFFAMILTEQLRRQHGEASLAADAPGRPSWLRAVLVLPMDYGVLCLSFLLLGALPAFLVVYTLIALATAAFLVLALAKWFREMKNLGSPR
ncbi:CDP-alcohol phosphatidyltransferase family protein [Salinibacterium hongtaonis]|uniref:CDP-alcohol phosphatidyltransferase family protein n=1 Tax=Homoserinimonas hongtaonis TaxID=2079791 RepID=UPI0018EFB769